MLCDNLGFPHAFSSGRKLLKVLSGGKIEQCTVCISMVRCHLLTYGASLNKNFMVVVISPWPIPRVRKTESSSKL